MSGEESAHSMRQVRPATKILYMSGYTDGRLDKLGESGEKVDLSLKPFTVEQVCRSGNAMPEQSVDYRRLLGTLGAEYYVYSHDVRGVFTYLSPSVTKMLGYTQAEFRKHYSRFSTANPINAEVERYTESSSKGIHQKPYSVEVLHKDGGARW
ncbi:hypothetical protein OY671_011197, partial [Metschnikowia pulcherrima]